MQIGPKEGDVWDAVIVGGGIAGCTAGIRLAQLGFSVLILERKLSGANKLCGEFLSPEASGYLTQLGVLDNILARGAQTITQFSVHEPRGAKFSCALPAPALGVSRRCLDSELMTHARKAGAECTEGCAVDSIIGSLDEGFIVTTQDQQFNARLVFGAYGKRAALDQTLGRPDKRSPFMALKTHFRGCAASQTIEMFSFPGGYGGFAPVESGLVNSCFILHRDMFERTGGKAETFFEWAGNTNPALGDRLSSLEREPDLIGCSNITFTDKSCFERDVCMIGDTAGMIAPVCGDGMAMAMHSALIASGTAARFLKGEFDAGEFKKVYTREWKRAYLLRLTLGRTLQRISMNSVATSAAVTLCAKLPALRNLLIHATRGPVGLPPKTLEGI